MTLSEDVLRDLLLEHGIEGVTLWHIKALAAYRKAWDSTLGAGFASMRFNSDMACGSADEVHAVALNWDKRYGDMARKFST